MLRKFLLVFCLAPYFAKNVALVVSPDGKWKKLSTNVAALSTIGRQTSTVSSMACWLLGNSKEDLSNIACYRDNICKLAWTDPTNVQGTQTQGWRCYQRIEPTCDTFTGTKVLPGTIVVHEFCPDEFTRQCTRGKLKEFRKDGKAISMRSSCTAPFESTSGGCFHVYLFTGVNKACENRMKCMDVGGDLASPRTTQDLTVIRNLIWTRYGFAGQVWIGAFYVDGEFRYIRDGRSPGAPGTGDWKTDQPQNVDQNKCTFVQGNYELASSICVYPRSPMCEVFL